MKIIIASSNHPGSLVIKLGTMSHWSHVGILIDDEVYDTTLGTGVSKQSLKSFQNRYPVTEILEIQVPDEDSAIKFLMQQMGKPYDWTALFGMVLQRNWQKDDSWFCSELVEAVLKAGGKQRFRDSVSRITPQQTWAVL